MHMKYNDYMYNTHVYLYSYIHDNDWLNDYNTPVRIIKSDNNAFKQTY